MQLSLSFILNVLKCNSRCHLKVIHLESTSIFMSNGAFLIVYEFELLVTMPKAYKYMYWLHFKKRE